MEPNETMRDADTPQSDRPAPMIKEETVKDDGRTLIYYTFPEAQDAPTSSATQSVIQAQEAAHV